MRPTKINSALFILMAVICLVSCNKWDDHVAINEQALNKSLIEYISEQPELGKFREYLVKTGLDKELQASKNYTVWAPSDHALASLPADVASDTAKLKAYLLNHISGQLFFTRNASDTVRVPMLNGKRVFFHNNKFDDATIAKADVYVRNGVLHVVDKVVAPLPSIWEYINNTKDEYEQNNFISSLNFHYQDPSKAELDSINPATGEPVYKPNTGIIEVNSFRYKVYDVANEDSLYTYVVLTNDAYVAEQDKLKTYFKSAVANATERNASWSVVKDLVIKGMYLPGELPQYLMSKYNVRVPINSNTIVASQRVSNGIVYVLNAASFAKEEKIPVHYIQGERPYDFSVNILEKMASKVFFRQRKDTATGRTFNDIYLNMGSGGANQFVDYFTNDLYAVKYKVYWVALNDKTISGQGDDPYGTDSTLQQIVKIGPYAAPFTEAFSVQKEVMPREYSEVYLGEYINDSYDAALFTPGALHDPNVFYINPATRRIRLQAPATLTTGIPYNLTLDYLKFVPVLE